MSEKLMLDSIGMRELAEYASSQRSQGGDPLYFVATPDPAESGSYTITPLGKDPLFRSPDDVVVPCDTAMVSPGRATLARITLHYRVPGHLFERHVEMDATQYDALFWSESAVEKFLFPYYASKYQWSAAEWLTAMSQAWYGFVPGMASGEPQEEVSDSFGEAAPMAMIHYPRSDYAFVEPGGTLEPGTDVQAVTVGGEGEVQLKPVAEYRRQPVPR